MSPLRRDARRTGDRAGHRPTKARHPAGVTLIELLMAMTITAMLSVVLGGIVLAVQTARQHTEGLEEATLQAGAALERIEFMIAHAGTYRAGGGPVTLGMAVVPRRWSSFDLPEALVVWSGGRTGGMADAGLQSRLPRINELVIYTPDPTEPRHLVEITHPANNGAIDFRDGSFASAVRTLIDSPDAKKTLLVNRIRRSQLSGFAGFSTAHAANVRFELTQSPTDADLAAAAPGTAGWLALPWSGGIVSSTSGLRQATVRIELQIEPRAHEARGADQKTIAIPFFGSEGIRYVYEP